MPRPYLLVRSWLRHGKTVISRDGTEVDAEGTRARYNGALDGHRIPFVRRGRHTLPVPTPRGANEIWGLVLGRACQAITARSLGAGLAIPTSSALCRAAQRSLSLIGERASTSSRAQRRTPHQRRSGAPAPARSPGLLAAGMHANPSKDLAR